MKSKKILSLILVVMMLCAVISGCASSDAPVSQSEAGSTSTAPAPSQEAAPSESEGGGDVSVVLSRWAGDHADAQKEIAKSYTAAQIIVDDIDYENLKEKQIQSMSASAEYDLIWVAEVWLPIYVNSGWLLPLDDYISRDGIDMNDYSQGIVNINTVDGKLYAMPDMMQGLFLTYNKEWFDREGQKVPTTVDELLEVAKYFKEQGTGIAIPAKQGQAAMDAFSTILYSAGGDYFDSDGNLDLNSEAVLYAADVYDKLCEYSIDGAAAWHHDQVAESIRTEKAPFGFMVSGLAGLDSNPEMSMIVDKVGYATIPGRNQVSGCVSTWSWAIAANSKNPDAAWEVVKWLTGEEIEKEMALKIGHTSAYSALSKNPEVISAVPFLSALLDQMANGRTQPIDPAAADLTDPIQVGLSTLATTDTPPAQVMADIQEKFGHIKIG